jgi:hypothetical protein
MEKMNIDEEKPVLLVEVLENPGNAEHPYLLRLTEEGLALLDKTKAKLVRNFLIENLRWLRFRFVVLIGLAKVSLRIRF